jgi:hypothetical protein
MTERRNPLKSMQQAQPTKEMVTAGTFDTASDYTPGHCPECQQHMVSSTCDGIPCYVCVEHRIVLPVGDSV